MTSSSNCGRSAQLSEVEVLECFRRWLESFFGDRCEDSRLDRCLSLSSLSLCRLPLPRFNFSQIHINWTQLRSCCLELLGFHGCNWIPPHLVEISV